MKTLIFVVFSILLSSCNLVDFNNKGFIDPEIKPYVDSFFDEASIRGVRVDTDNLRVFFDKKSKETDPFNPGCSKVNVFRKSIYIDKYTFDHSTELEKEMLIFHELGHAILDRKHNENTMSIMYSTGVANFSIYKLNRTSIIDELFFN